MGPEQWVIAGVIAVVAAYIAYRLGRAQQQAAVANIAPAPTPEPVASAPEPEPAPASKSAGASAPVEELRTVTSSPPEPEIPKLGTEEDEDVDPTRVGAGAVEAAPFHQPTCMKLVYDEDAEADEPTRAESLFLVYSAAQTDAGLRRKRNEDALLTLDKHGLFVVADGMGGYKGGALASALAVKTMADAFESNRFAGVLHADLPAKASELARAIQMANGAILSHASKDKGLTGMGTTIVAARFAANKQRLFIGHVGDSRCYRLRNGVLTQMTADHTMRDFGVTGPESAQLSRAVGIWPAVPIDIILAMPVAGDSYLLCSDGLTKMLPDDTIRAVLTNESDANEAIERLIFFANSRGGKDNITVVLVRVVDVRKAAKPS